MEIVGIGKSKRKFPFNDDSPSHQGGPRRLKYLDWYAPNVDLIKTEVWERGLFGRKVGNVELLSFGGSGGQS
jgi:hypothetical protein